jgi:hypothetical protein
MTENPSESKKTGRREYNKKREEDEKEVGREGSRTSLQEAALLEHPGDPFVVLLPRLELLAPLVQLGLVLAVAFLPGCADEVLDRGDFVQTGRAN